MPVYNASKFLDRTVGAIERQREESGWEMELIMIDDGSRDNTYSVVEGLQNRYPYIKGIKLSRNFGHQAAVRTGLAFCSGEYVAVIDDDLQDPPSLLPQFFAKLDEGYDVAYGERRKRKENFVKRASYKTFYQLLRRMSSIDIPLDSGDFCVMKRRVVRHMLALPERNPFLRGMRAWVGFKQIAVTYERQARVDGVSAYTFWKLLQLAVDGIFSFSKMPIRLITLAGLLGLVVAVSYSLFLLILLLTVGVEGRGFSTLALLISFFGSLNLICLGTIGEYIARIYDESLGRPHTVIEKTFNFEESNEHAAKRSVPSEMAKRT